MKLSDLMNGPVPSGFGYVVGPDGRKTMLTPQGVFDEEGTQLESGGGGPQYSMSHLVDFLGTKGYLQPSGEVIGMGGNRIGDIYGGEKQRQALAAQDRQMKQMQWQNEQDKTRAEIEKLMADARQSGAPKAKPQAEWKYDAGSDTWVSAPSEEFPQGRITQPAGKVAAAKSMDYVIDQFKPALDATPQGGFMGVSGLIGKVTDSQAAKRFDNLREQLSTEIRTVYRIPGEGALSDREQAQYGIQLPAVTNDRKTNEQILQDLRARTGLRFSVGQGVESVPKSQQAAQPTQQPAAQSGPKVGAIRGGYVFLGGDPASPTSWKAIK